MDKALTLLADRRFHRCFYLPPDESAGRPTRLRVTYADVGYGSGLSTSSSPQNQAGDAVVLFIGGMMGGRWSLVRSDRLARKFRVRILTVDRPGLGGSDPVPIEKRIETWLATVPALLTHLNIKHVALACHSGGAIYTFNILIHLRHLLHPQRPYVAFLAPWVHPEHSGQIAMRLTASLPSWAVGNFDSIARFVNSYVRPAVGFSSGIAGVLGDKGGANTDSTLDDGPVGEEHEDHDKEEEEEEEEDAWSGSLMGTLIGKYMFAEDISGSSDEALLYLKRAVQKPAREVVSWGGAAWKGYDDCVRLVAAQQGREIARRKVDDDTSLSQSTITTHTNQPQGVRGARKLQVDAYHAENDSMVGTKGATYFDACWGDGGSDSSSKEGVVGDVVEYRSRTCEGTDHETVLDPSREVMAMWLERVARCWYGEEGGRGIDLI